MKKSDPHLLMEEWVMLIKDHLEKQGPIPDIKDLRVIERTGAIKRERLESCNIKDFPDHFRTALIEARRKGLLMLLQRAMEIYSGVSDDSSETKKLNSFNLGLAFGKASMFDEIISTPALVCSEVNMKAIHGLVQSNARGTRRIDAPKEVVEWVKDQAKTLKKQKPSWSRTRIVDYIRDCHEELRGGWSVSTVRDWVFKAFQE